MTLTKTWWAVKIRLTLAVFYTVLITISFVLPSDNIPEVTLSLWELSLPYTDKIAHLIVHVFLLVFWLFYLDIRVKPQLKATHFFWVFVVVLVYGIVIEVIQNELLPSRQADFFDVLANLIGCVFGIILFVSFKKVSQRSR